MYILVEYAPYGDLCGYLRACAQHDANYVNRPSEQAIVISSKRLRFFAHDIACGMEFLAMHKV